MKAELPDNEVAHPLHKFCKKAIKLKKSGKE